MKFSAIVSLHPEVAHRDGGEIELERFPVGAVVARKDRAAFGSDIEHAPLLGVLADRVEIHVLLHRRGQQLPRLPVVGGLRKVRSHVVEPMAFDHHVRRARIEGS